MINNHIYQKTQSITNLFAVLQVFIKEDIGDEKKKQV